MRSRVVVSLVVLLGAGAARAEDAPRDRCTAAYDSTQRLRQAGKLREAHGEALACADATCPRVLRQDCARWVDELDRATPSVVLRATGADGCDIVDAEVTIDGAIVARRLQGAPFALDPGVHVVRLQPASGPPIEQRVVLVEGDRDRRIELSAAAAGASCGAPRAAAAPTAEPSATGVSDLDRPTPPLAYALGALGLASVGSGAAFAISGFSKRSDLDTCKPYCKPDDVASARRTFVVSDVLIGVGLVSLAVAVYLYASRPTRSAKAAFLVELPRF
jgi:hypothetical protein